MADAGKLKSRLENILKILPVEEVESRNKEVKFALKISPFDAKNFIVVVEYLPKVDMLRVVASVGIGKNLRENFKTKNDPEKNEIISIFSKPLRNRSFSPMIANDFSALEGFRFLIQQNLSAQTLLDTVTEGIFVLQDLAELLIQADQSIKPPKVSETNHNMFQ